MNEDVDPQVRQSEFTVPEDAAGLRLDTWMARQQNEFSRTFFQQLIKDGRVLVNNQKAKPSQVLEGGEQISVDFPPPEDPWPHPQDLPVEVIHHDDDIIVVNKAAGMIVHPAAGNPDGTLVNALLHHFPDLPGINGVKRPGIVHRLDRDTSGVMVVAKNDRAMKILANAIKERQVTRIYVALALGEAEWNETSVDAPIGRHETMRHKRAVNGAAPRSAKTHFRLLARAHGFSLLQCRLETGRTHQIRVHCAHIGMPIAGDWLYGGKSERVMEKLRNSPSSLRTTLQRLDRPFLHARLLRLRHPANQQWHAYTAPLPPELQDVIDELLPGLELNLDVES